MRFITPAFITSLKHKKNMLAAAEGDDETVPHTI